MFKGRVNRLLLLSPTRLLPRGGHGMVGCRGLHTRPACWQQMVQVTVSEDKRKVKLLCEGEQERRLHGIWLRHNCRCPTCTSVHHNQTVVDPKLLHRDLQVESARLNGEHWAALCHCVLYDVLNFVILYWRRPPDSEVECIRWCGTHWILSSCLDQREWLLQP